MTIFAKKVGMIINSETRISKLIEVNKETIDIISSINKHFRKLKNPILRKTLASRVTIADAARIGGVTVELMIEKLQTIGFETLEKNVSESNTQNKKNRTINNIEMKRETIIELDVRPILAKGTDPFKSIMAELDKMADGSTLMIINSFEPIPLLNILKTKGYTYETERPEDGVVHTFLEKSGEEKVSVNETVVAQNLNFEDVELKYKGKMTEVDVRHLEMPLPMVTILEEIEKVGEGSALYVHHKKLPQYLIPELEDSNFQWVSKEIDVSNLKLIIFK
jgi:uncharacterized protein (DUF2249 family)